MVGDGEILAHELADHDAANLSVLTATNLAIRLEPQARQLNADLNLWTKIKPAQSRQTHKVDADALKNFKSLGYVQ